MNKPIIGVTGFIQNDDKNNISIFTVNSSYLDSITNSGGIPVLLPITSDEETINTYINKIDGLLVTGGSDVNPLEYNEEPLSKTGYFDFQRDKFEIELIHKVHNAQKPILGICRGIQIMNVAFKGTLYQDLSYIDGSFVKHRQEADRNVPSHSIELKKGSKLFEVYGQTAAVNSFHHQAVKTLGNGFVVTAKAKDGVVEGIELEGKVFTVAVQWHPEGMFENDIKSQNLFNEFIKSCK